MPIGVLGQHSKQPADGDGLALRLMLEVIVEAWPAGQEFAIGRQVNAVRKAPLVRFKLSSFVDSAATARHPSNTRMLTSFRILRLKTMRAGGIDTGHVVEVERCRMTKCAPKPRLEQLEQFSSSAGTDVADEGRDRAPLGTSCRR